MPHSFESRPLVRSAKKEWVVQRRKPCVYKGIRTDACVIRIKKYGKKDNFVLVRFPRVAKNGRVDLKIEPPELVSGGKKVYFHRCVGYAWRGDTYEDVGGVTFPLPKDLSWEQFDQFEVHHNTDLGSGEVLIDGLKIVTPARNKELYELKVLKLKALKEQIMGISKKRKRKRNPPADTKKTRTK